MKDIFKGAVIRASCGVGPLRDFYVALLDKGMKPEMARLGEATNGSEYLNDAALYRAYGLELLGPPLSIG